LILQISNNLSDIKFGLNSILESFKQVNTNQQDLLVKIVIEKELGNIIFRSLYNCDYHEEVIGLAVKLISYYEDSSQYFLDFL